MFIPTQKERYRKAARVTLLLCVMVPSALVAWLDGELMAFMYGCSDAVFILSGFLWPVALPLCYGGMAAGAALFLSALIQLAVFWWMVRTPRYTPKHRLTFAITWGMLFAFLLRVAIAFEAWRLGLYLQ